MQSVEARPPHNTAICVICCCIHDHAEALTPHDGGLSAPSQLLRSLLPHKAPATRRSLFRHYLRLQPGTHRCRLQRWIQIQMTTPPCACSLQNAENLIPNRSTRMCHNSRPRSDLEWDTRRKKCFMIRMT